MKSGKQQSELFSRSVRDGRLFPHRHDKSAIMALSYSVTDAMYSACNGSTRTCHCAARSGRSSCRPATGRSNPTQARAVSADFAASVRRSRGCAGALGSESCAPPWLGPYERAYFSTSSKLNVSFAKGHVGVILVTIGHLLRPRILEPDASHARDVRLAKRIRLHRRRSTCPSIPAPPFGLTTQSVPPSDGHRRGSGVVLGKRGRGRASESSSFICS